MASSSMPAANADDADLDDPYGITSIHEYYAEPERGPTAGVSTSREGQDDGFREDGERPSGDGDSTRTHDSSTSPSRDPSHQRREGARQDSGESANGPGSRRGASDGQKNGAVEEEPLFGSGVKSRERGSDDHRNGDAPRGTEQEEVEEDEDDRDGFYALLNVQKDATEDQIRDAYRSLAVVLHPDKHRSPELKESAESRFRAIQHAYEVLIDAEKRAIYDHFGVKGLRQDWSLVQCSNVGGPRSAAELRDEWERLARKKRADEIDNMVRSKGEYMASIDASALFCAPERVPRSKEVLREVGRELMRREKESGVPFKDGDVVELPPVSAAERWNRVGLTTLVGRHGWETPITSFTRVLFNGQMVSRGGVGGGSLSGTVRTQWSRRLMTDVTTTLTHPRLAAFKGQYEFSQYSFITLVASGQTPAVPPQLQLTFAQRLSEKSALTGFTSFRTGAYTLGSWGKGLLARKEPPNITVGISDQKADGKGWSTSASVAVDNQALSTEYSFRPAFLGSPKVRVGLTLGTASGLAAFNAVDRKVTDNVRIGFGVNFGIPSGGVTLRLRFARLGQRLTVPIQISPEYRPDLVSTCTFLPALGLLALEHLYIRPSRRRKIHTRLESLRTQHADLIAQRKQAAIEAIDVLRAGAHKRANFEWRHDGLVVVQAFYGKRDRWPAWQGADDSLEPEEIFAATWSKGELSTEASRADAEVESERRAAPPVPGQEPLQEWWDVTIPVMMLVQKSQLIIAGDRAKHKLLGFFDPCMGERKHLVVRYLFRGRLHEVVVDDVTQLTAPLRSHQL